MSAERAAPAERSDSEQFPWTQDFSGVWHRRPAGRPWITGDDVNAETVCGHWISSVHVSNTEPEGPKCVACTSQPAPAGDDEHRVTEHWDHEGGDVLERSCSCGERWTRDESTCPSDDGEPAGDDELREAERLFRAVVGVERHEGPAHRLLAEYDERGRELQRLRAEQHEMTCPACQATIRARLADQQEQAELKRLREERTRLLSECDRIEQHIREHVPHLPPDAGHLTVHVIRLLLGEAPRRDDGGTGR